MHRLILLRHGKAEADATSGQDFDRALTDRGRRDAALIARTLADRGYAPDLALVSPAARTWQTWQAASPFFPKARAEKVPALYHAEPDEILALAQNEDEAAGAVMVIGHNPGVGQLAAFLAKRAAAPTILAFPTSAAAVVDFSGGQPPMATAFELFAPKALGGGT